MHRGLVEKTLSISSQSGRAGSMMAGKCADEHAPMSIHQLRSVPRDRPGRNRRATAFGRSFALHEMVYAVGMNWLLIMAALACNPGDRLVDLRDKIPRA
jgi:hypothetical protein